MKKFLWALALAGTLGSAAHALPNAPDVIPTKNGAIRITPIYHGSLQIEYRGKVIHVDPFSAGDYSGAKKADFMLITHSHPDHFDVKAMKRVRKSGLAIASVVAPPIIVTQIRNAGFTVTPLGGGIPKIAPSGEDISVMNFVFGTVGTKSQFLIKVQALPSYNLVRGPKPGAKFHPKGEFNGYILTLGGKRIYIAGDTEATPEMKALKNIDIAFLPMNLPYTMTPQEAAAGARAFKPKVVYPYHYRFPFTKANDNPQQFAKALAGSGIQVRLRGWYDHPAAK
ncbi:L-ascorbate metabolism protein UlaG, beta-lactamase superfamily [Abditibacterium utsteinense]|uniref:L-ascorbate metabolism protein UlaG, beta-lactamase superfamily n=1 Tax=Abditibacterium utsteinense TaxID=1960156 RepID=A0A2S8SWC0_9BACT|nr:MBL fold metallo-hydrolase [Abditibacterium utsteinense]PQV65095.1 L-ascorbate metabolism protein UlaG, beta-lactamase superfamily [Abditibacterium utsteinense]